MHAHTVQFYEQPEALGESVAAFFRPWLEDGDEALVITSAENHAAIVHRLGEGLGAQVRFLDARTTLAAFMVDGRPDTVRFEETIGAALRSVRCAQAPAVYGDMVALLHAEGDTDGAIALEALWNRLARTQAFRLLCGYPMATFADPTMSSEFATICGLHTEVLPAHDRRWHSMESSLRQEVALLQQKAAALEAETAARRQAEQDLLERDRRKDDFLAMLGHELRNPLTPIAAALESIGHHADDPERVRQARDVAARQMDILQRLVEDILDVSRIARGKIQVHKRPTLLTDIIERAKDIAAKSIEEKEHLFDLRYEDAPAVIDGDAVRLSQAIGNLLLNAARYSPAGGRITVHACIEGEEALIRIRDTGEGMSASFLEKAFRPFVDSASHLPHDRMGLGLGLNVAKTITELHGGSLEAQSAGPGRGSELRMRLPLSPATVVEERVTKVQQATGRRILIVDDNVAITESLAMLLRALGHEVHTTNDASSGLDLGQRMRPDVAIVDLGMPFMDGFEMARRARATPWGQRCRLVAHSGYASPEDLARSRAAGFDHHLRKPPDMDELEAVLAHEPLTA